MIDSSNPTLKQYPNLNDGKTTVVITSYNRWTFLQQTLDSLMTADQHLIDRYVVIEDSMNKDIAQNIINKYGDKVDLIFNAQRIGQAPSLDKAYRTVWTQYILHSEDDYLYEGNTNFIQQSIDILQERKDLHQVFIRHWSDFADNGGYEQFENQIFHTSTVVPYKLCNKQCGWCGFSWNAGLRRTVDYLSMFPEGFSKFTGPESFRSGVQTEYRCNAHAQNQGYHGCILLNGACWNKGKNSHNICTYKG